MEHFSNGAFLKWSNSQMERFSNGAILKWSNSQMEQFSNGAIWGRHHQLDDSLAGQLTTNYHTWYLSFFFTHTFSGLKILHSKVRKLATKIATRQNSLNQYWEVKFTFIFLAATFDHEIMKRKGRLALPPWASWSPLSLPCWKSLRSATYKSSITH